MAIERIGIISSVTYVVENVIDVDTDLEPPETWPSTWITSTGKVNTAEVGYAYVPVLNGFLPPQPDPTFVLETSDLTWYPDPEVYYYWTSPVEMYYLYNKTESNWTPEEIIGSSPSEPFPLPVYPTLSLVASQASINPGDFVDITLTSSGSNQPQSALYSVSMTGGTVAFEYIKQICEVTTAVSTEDSVSPVFFFNGLELPSYLLSRGCVYEFDQSDASNTGHPLLLSETPNGTNASPTPGTIYDINVEYFLDGVQVADSSTYLSGFDSATQRKILINPLDPLQPTNLYYFDHTVTPGVGYINNFNLLQIVEDAPNGSFFYPSVGSTVRFGVSAGIPSATTTVGITVSGCTQEPVTTSFDVVPL